MADIGVAFTLTADGGTVVFNDGSADQLYLNEIGGLGGAPIRAPIDDVPFGDGGIVHDFWKGPRHIVADGVFLVTSTRNQDAIVAIRNGFEEDLRVALESCMAADATFAWTPQGEAARTLTVRHDVQLDFGHEQNYLLSTFHFGLVAADPDWV